MTKAIFELVGGWLIRRTSKLPTTIPEALEHSIQKWEFIEGVLLKDTDSEPACGGAESCALCSMPSSCEVCPIAAAGHDGCDGTPYYTYAMARDHAEALDACRAEIAFLKSLREDGDPIPEPKEN